MAGNGATRLTGGTISLHDYIPGLQLVGGSVQLLPDFQGGAGITNLVLDGTTLSGTNTVTGTLTLRNGSLGGVLLIQPGATFNIESANGKTLSAIVTNRGTFNLSGTGDVSLTGSLDNGGEEIAFVGAQTNLITRFQYDGAKPWPVYSNTTSEPSGRGMGRKKPVSAFDTSSIRPVLTSKR